MLPSCKSLNAVVCLLTILVGMVKAAAIENTVGEPRIHSSDELISTIVDNCFNANGMQCIKQKVLAFLDTLNGIEENVSGRAFDDEIMDKLMVDRVARILSTNEIRVQLPETIFQSSIVTYHPQNGFNMIIPETEARGKKKDKLLTPLLLLMKFKLKVVMPIIMTLIGLKAFKALILSKIAIKLVLGFIIYNLIQKLGGVKMSMTPMMPAPEYVIPSSTSSYEPGSWDSSGGPYARWDSQNLAYNAYHPSSSYSSSSSSSS